MNSEFCKREWDEYWGVVVNLGADKAPRLIPISFEFNQDDERHLAEQHKFQIVHRFRMGWHSRNSKQ